MFKFERSNAEQPTILFLVDESASVSQDVLFNFVSLAQESIKNEDLPWSHEKKKIMVFGLSQFLFENAQKAKPLSVEKLEQIKDKAKFSFGSKGLATTLSLLKQRKDIDFNRVETVLIFTELMEPPPLADTFAPHTKVFYLVSEPSLIEFVLERDEGAEYQKTGTMMVLNEFLTEQRALAEKTHLSESLPSAKVKSSNPRL